MRKNVKVAGVSFGIFVLLSSILFVHSFIYPFTVQNPNYSDVERVFNRMQFPSDWEEVGSSENDGIAGRQCPAESESACFHKSKTFEVPASLENKSVEQVLESAGCLAPISVEESNPIGGAPYIQFECSTEGLEIHGQIDKEPSGYKVSILILS